MACDAPILHASVLRRGHSVVYTENTLVECVQCCDQGLQRSLLLDEWHGGIYRFHNPRARRRLMLWVAGGLIRDSRTAETFQKIKGVVSKYSFTKNPLKKAGRMQVFDEWRADLVELCRWRFAWPYG
jgi:hypothetical protein